jgi:predicted secreted acid phosphatase
MNMTRNKTRQITTKNGIMSCSNRIDSILSQCLILIKKYKNNHPTQKLAVVFDLDFTVIFYDNDDKPCTNKSVFKFYKNLINLNIAIFFITARPSYQNNRLWTKNELKELGYDKYKSLKMMKIDSVNNDINKSLSKFNYRTIISKTYTIILNIGDNFSDLMLQFPYVKSPKILKLIQEVMLKYCNSKIKYCLFKSLDNTTKYSLKFPAEK